MKLCPPDNPCDDPCPEGPWQAAAAQFLLSLAMGFANQAGILLAQRLFKKESEEDEEEETDED